MSGTRRHSLGALLALLLLTGCTPLTPSAVLPSPSPTTTLAPPTATPTPLPTPTPTATPTPTPIPPPDPAALPELANAGAAQVHAAVGDAVLLCFRYEDLTNDGLPEWLALLHQPEAGRLSAFVLRDEHIHTLLDAKPDPGKPYYGLGQYPTCEIEIRDVNADGKTEIAIFGHAERSLTLLHLYAWDEGAGDFRLVGAFQGDAGVSFENRDGDLADEILEGHRDTGAPQLAWRVIFTWDGQTYGWTWDRWDWYFLERPHDYPTHRADYAVISFYLALNDRDLPGAYALLADSARAAQPYESWALGFARTLRVDVSGVQRVAAASNEEQARVNAMVTAWDNEEGLVIGRLWEVTWETVHTDAGWRLLGATTQLLDTWDAPYWK